MKSTNHLALLLSLLAPCAFVQAANYEATISFSNKITLSLPVTGIINEVNIENGQKVRAGQLLLSLEQTSFKADVDMALANVAVQKTAETASSRDLKHAQELFDRAVLSTVSLQNARLKHQQASARLDEATARLSKARYELEHSRVNAPFNGWVLKTHVRKNEMINNAVKQTPLITLAEVQKYTASSVVSLDTIKTLKEGQNANISIDNTLYTGKVKSTTLEPVNSKTGKDARYLVNIEFLSEQLIHAGQPATVELP